MASHDPLTGLPNRRVLQNEIEEALVQPGAEERIALLYMDLDRFKQVNDSLGHGVGDALLAQVADRLRDSIRPTDQVARLGGDEFAILVHGGAETRDHAAEIARRLIESVSTPFQVEGHVVSIGASIGSRRLIRSPPGASGSGRLGWSAVETKLQLNSPVWPWKVPWVTRMLPACSRYGSRFTSRLVLVE